MSAANTELKPESERIRFLMQRDGPEATRAWVQRTLEIYRQALHDGDSMYRARFEQAVREFEEWLATQVR